MREPEKKLESIVKSEKHALLCLRAGNDHSDCSNSLVRDVGSSKVLQFASCNLHFPVQRIGKVSTCRLLARRFWNLSKTHKRSPNFTDSAPYSHTFTVILHHARIDFFYPPTVFVFVCCAIYNVLFKVSPRCGGTEDRCVLALGF